MNNSWENWENYSPSIQKKTKMEEITVVTNRSYLITLNHHLHLFPSSLWIKRLPVPIKFYSLHRLCASLRPAPRRLGLSTSVCISVRSVVCLSPTQGSPFTNTKKDSLVHINSCGKSATQLRLKVGTNLRVATVELPNRKTWVLSTNESGLGHNGTQ